jgi:aromatic-L-amino-acid decarboxylase
VIQDTASTSTLVALICARERATDHAQVRGGLQAQAKPLIVYVSAHAHSSVDKAALLAGFGRDNIRLIATDEQFAMRPEALRGPSNKTSLPATSPAPWSPPPAPPPPLRSTRCARSARSPRPTLWLHVDSAMAGSAMILPNAAGCGTASSWPTRWWSTRTSGWAWPSTAPSTTCAIRST